MKPAPFAAVLALTGTVVTAAYWLGHSRATAASLESTRLQVQ